MFVIIFVFLVYSWGVMIVHQQMLQHTIVKNPLHWGIDTMLKYLTMVMLMYSTAMVLTLLTARALGVQL